MLTVTMILLFIALILLVVSAAGKLPLWPSSLFVIVALLLQHFRQ